MIKLMIRLFSRKNLFLISITLLFLQGCSNDNDIKLNNNNNNNNIDEFEKNIDWKSFLSLQCPVWDTLTSDFYDGPMTGNGLIGTVMHRMDRDRFDRDTNKILFEINRTDLIDSCKMRPEGYYWSRMQVGRFEFKPKGIIRKFNFKIDLLNAEVIGTISTTEGVVRIKHYTHAEKPVIITELETEGNENSDNWKFVPDLSGCLIELNGLDRQENGIYDTNPPAEIRTKNGIFLHKQVLKHSGRHFTVGSTSKKVGSKTIYFSTLEYSHPVKAKRFEAAEILSDCVNKEPTNLVNSHRKWWSDYFKQSFVSIPDVRILNYYWIQRYVTGCVMRDGLQMNDLMGAWYAHTPWQGIWWNLNSQFMYSHLFSSNNINPVKSYCSIFDENLPSLIQNVPKKYRKDAAGLGRASSFNLLSKVNPDDSIPPYYNREIGNLTFALHNYYLYCRFSIDDTLLKHKFYPLLKKSVNLYVNLAYKAKDGKYHLPMTMSPEYKPAHDCNYDLSLFKWGLQTLIITAEKFKIKEHSLKKWKELNSNLVDYPTNERGLLIGKDVEMVTAHRHFAHLLMINPLATLTNDTPKNEELIRKSLKYWINLPGNDKAGFTYTWCASAYAYIGDGNNSFKYLNGYFSYTNRKHYWDIPGIGDNTLYREVGMCSETPFSFNKSVNDMLLQSHNNVINIFPAIPQIWKDASFLNLRAEGAFLITAVREDSKTKFFSIESLAGEPCVVKTDIQVDSILTSPHIILNKKSEFTFSATIKKGQKILFHNKKSKSLDFTYVIDESERNNYWGSKR